MNERELQLITVVLSPPTDLTLSLINAGMDENSHGVTLTGVGAKSWDTRIELSVSMVWPLLVPEFSNSEKVSHTFWFANTIVHELCVRGPPCPHTLFSIPLQPSAYAS